MKLKVREEEEPIDDKKRTQLSYGNLYEKQLSDPSSSAGPVPAWVFAKSNNLLPAAHVSLILAFIDRFVFGRKEFNRRRSKKKRVMAQ